MEADHQQLADRQALADLLSRYAACIDERDFERYRDCFASDVEAVGFDREPIRGVDAWVAFVERQISRFRATQHLLGPQLAEIDGDRADLRTDLQAIHWPLEAAGETFTLWGTYRTGAVRRDGVWQIRRHTLEVRAVELAGT